MEKGVLELPQSFSLGLTLLCGQCFRWEGPDPEEWFEGVAGQVYWRLRQDVRKLFWECSEPRVRGLVNASWLAHYLSLDDPLEEWANPLEDHPILGLPLKSLRGLRLLRQEPWECAISYMFAQGLSVKVIRHVLAKFCAEHGGAVPGVPGFYRFPEPEALSSLSPDFLKPFTNNYRDRADRVIRAARTVEAGVLSLERLREISCDEAREALMFLDGIGPKIADCILLFSMGQLSAFPVDRWVLRAMQKHFRSIRLFGPDREAPTYSQYIQIVRRARKAFGDRCGVASEYLFLFLRLLEDPALRASLRPYGGGLESLSIPSPTLGRKAFHKSENKI